jgi:tripartite-type tricarboxylate transporter receptor subunit TctC
MVAAARAGMLVAYITICVVSGLGPASAEDWPSHPVKVVVPYGPGGIADTLAWLTANRLAKSFGQPFIVENKGGAGGIAGTEFAARSPNDGYAPFSAGGA